MYTQILLHAACETLWEPEGAWQDPSNTRPGCSQVASVTAQDGSPGPAQPQRWVRTKPTKPCPRAGSRWCSEAPRYSGWHCSHAAECFVQQLQHDLIFIFFFLLILQQWSPYYLNCIVLYMPIQIPALNPTTICFSQGTHSLVISS